MKCIYLMPKHVVKPCLCLKLNSDACNKLYYPHSLCSRVKKANDLSCFISPWLVHLIFLSKFL